MCKKQTFVSILKKKSLLGLTPRSIFRRFLFLFGDQQRKVKKERRKLQYKTQRGHENKQTCKNA